MRASTTGRAPSRPSPIGCDIPGALPPAGGRPAQMPARRAARRRAFCHRTDTRWLRVRTAAPPPALLIGVQGPDPPAVDENVHQTRRLGVTVTEAPTSS